MQVKYLRDVTSPREQQGRAGEVKNLPDRTARLLLDGGFVEKVLPAPISDGKKKGKLKTKAEENNNESSSAQEADTG